MTIEYNKRVVGAHIITNCNICSSPVGQSERERESRVNCRNEPSIFFSLSTQIQNYSLLLDLGFLLF